MKDNYSLSKDEHEAIYENLIEAESFAASTPVEKPQAILLGGQMGAGKSTIDRALEQKFENNFVRISTDELRRYHPQNDEIGLLDDKLYGQLTHPDASAWQMKLFDRATELGHNVRYEGTLQDATGILNRLYDLKEKGYYVELQIVATHERNSSQGIYTRYEAEKLESGFGRYVPQEMHDKAYALLPETIRQIEELGAADRIGIFNRNGESVHDNRLEDGKWSNPGSADALEKERSKELTPEQVREYSQRWDELVIKPMQERGAPQKEIDKVLAVSQRFEKDLGIEKDQEQDKNKARNDLSNELGAGPQQKLDGQNNSPTERHHNLDPGRVNTGLGYDDRLIRELYDKELNQFDLDLIDREISNDLRDQSDSICDPLGLTNFPQVSEIAKQVGQELFQIDRADMLANPPDYAKDFDPEYKWIVGTDPGLAKKLWDEQSPADLQAEIDKPDKDRLDLGLGKSLWDSHKPDKSNTGKEVVQEVSPQERQGKTDKGLEIGAQESSSNRTESVPSTRTSSTNQQFGYGIDTMKSGHDEEKKEQRDEFEIGER